MHSYLKCATTHKESVWHHFLPSLCLPSLPPPAQVNNLLHPRHHFPGQTSLKHPHPHTQCQDLSTWPTSYQRSKYTNTTTMYLLCSPFTAHAAMNYIIGPLSKVTHTYISCNLPSKYKVSPLYIALQSTRDHMSHITHVNISCNMNQCSRPAPSFPDGLHRTTVTWYEHYTSCDVTWLYSWHSIPSRVHYTHCS